MANEKISFFDSEKDILIEAYISPAEAQRAVTDIAFAAELYERVIIQNSESSSFNNVNENNVNTETFDIEESNNTGDLNFESQEGEGSLYRWSPLCVLLLLESYKSMEDTLNSGKSPKKNCGKGWPRNE
ncbi:hypothetical protein K1T71_008774 [Dendrolimus kikuchii]|uniref:Uncharacterized protein n=1 Tax=Dendrolimus kikuchii TaxID=765133 RepID=A0ACC1CVP0_9NEOP|nr:hypothetical protein K1T71_008774 [Dendrolimus kikuchii]